jgi:hypothetical protein
VIADLLNTKITELAQVAGVRMIDENLPRVANGEENSWNVVAGTYVIGQKPKLYQAGVDGSGKYLKDVDNAPTSTAVGVRLAGPEDVDWNGNGVLDNAAQIIADTDTAWPWTRATSPRPRSPAAGTETTRRETSLASATGLTNRNHRKIAWYEVAPRWIRDR